MEEVHATLTIGEVLFRLLIALLLVAANGFFVAAEFALVGARRTRIEQMAATGNRRARLARVVEGLQSVHPEPPQTRRQVRVAADDGRRRGALDAARTDVVGPCQQHRDGEPADEQGHHDESHRQRQKDSLEVQRQAQRRPNQPARGR